MTRAALMFCMLGTLSGCSFLYVTPPPADHIQRTEIQCTARRVSPILDTLVAGGAGLLTLMQVTDSDASIATSTSGRTGVGLVTVGAAVLWGASAISGFVTVSECREALAALEQRRAIGLQQTPAAPATPNYYAPPTQPPPLQLPPPPLPPPSSEAQPTQSAPTQSAAPAPREAPVLLFPSPPPSPVQTTP